MQANGIRAITTAMMENTAASGGKLEASTAAYKAFIESAFPFTIKARGETDKKMVEVMQKEAAKGPITFAAIAQPNPFAKAVKTMTVPDEFKKKLQDRVIQQRARMRK